VRIDACGAGDRFAVAAAVALANGADPCAAVVAAVEAAARFVSAGGAAAVSTPAEKKQKGGAAALLGYRSPDAMSLVRRLRADGHTVVATGGCFDLLHTGHVRLLRQARQLGDALIVLINSDQSVQRLKGPGRPIMPAADRARVLSALACVDAVAVFDEPTPQTVLAAIRPDIWVKGGDYTAAELPEADVVRRHGGQVVILPTFAGYSSSKLIAAAWSSHTTEGE
jgi:rfaE bifunctional protein nucleotidyltransferase chain/domain